MTAIDLRDLTFAGKHRRIDRARLDLGGSKPGCRPEEHRRKDQKQVILGRIFPIARYLKNSMRRPRKATASKKNKENSDRKERFGRQQEVKPPADT